MSSEDTTQEDTLFIVRLSVFADSSDDCNARMTYNCNRHAINPRMMMMMMLMTNVVTVSGSEDSGFDVRREMLLGDGRG